jgi:hypothetical protein
MKLFSSIAGFFRARYIGLVEFLVTGVMLVVNGLMRHLILLKGKNPDGTVQPPAPPEPERKDPPFDPARAEQTIQRFHNAPRTNVMNDGEWVTNMSRHPVILSRAQAAQAPQDAPQDGPLPSDELTESEVAELMSKAGADKEWLEVIQSSASKVEDK